MVHYSGNRLYFEAPVDLGLVAGLLGATVVGPVIRPDGCDASLVREVLRLVRGALLDDHYVWLGGSDLVTDHLDVCPLFCHLVGVSGLPFGLDGCPVVLVVARAHI